VTGTRARLRWYEDGSRILRVVNGQTTDVAGLYEWWEENLQ
jgi:hypothetical protein